MPDLAPKGNNNEPETGRLMGVKKLFRQACYQYERVSLYYEQDRPTMHSNIKHCNKLVIRFDERGASTVFRVCRKRGAMTHDSSSFFLFLHTLLSNFLLLPPLFEPSIFFEGEKKTTMAIPNIQIWVKEKFPVSMLGNKTY